MGLLLLGAAAAPGERLIARLLAEGDDVRVVEHNGVSARRWTELGAHVARGSPLDEDLVARAAEGVRTIVVLDDPGYDLDQLVVTAIGAADALAHPIRLVVGARRVGRATLDALTTGPREHVVLLAGARPRGRRRAGTQDDAVAEAIDAADDLAGSPHLVLDLERADSWRALGLEPNPAALRRATGTRCL